MGMNLLKISESLDSIRVLTLDSYAGEGKMIV